MAASVSVVGVGVGVAAAILARKESRPAAIAPPAVHEAIDAGGTSGKTRETPSQKTSAQKEPFVSSIHPPSLPPFLTVPIPDWLHRAFAAVPYPAVNPPPFTTTGGADGILALCSANGWDKTLQTSDTLSLAAPALVLDFDCTLTLVHTWGLTPDTSQVERVFGDAERRSAIRNLLSFGHVYILTLNDERQVWRWLVLAQVLGEPSTLTVVGRRTFYEWYLSSCASLDPLSPARSVLSYDRFAPVSCVKPFVLNAYGAPCLYVDDDPQMRSLAAQFCPRTTVHNAASLAAWKGLSTDDLQTLGRAFQALSTVELRFPSGHLYMPALE